MPRFRLAVRPPPGWDLILVALLFAVVVWVSNSIRPPTPVVRTAPVEKLLAQFEDIVFRVEYGIVRRFNTLDKWDGPLRIALRGENVAWLRPTLEANAATLSRLTGLEMTVPNPATGDENVIVFVDRMAQVPSILEAHFGGADSFEEGIADGATCLGQYSPNWHGVINAYKMLITTDGGPHGTRSCLLEEFTQGLGLPNDSDIIRPTIFSDLDDPEELTINDMILVRALYDPRIKPGMVKDEAMALAREIIPELVDKVHRHGERALYQGRGPSR